MINLNEVAYNKPFITRDIIKKQLSDYDVYRHYISYDFKINEVFNSPFRKDNLPSFGLFYNNNGELIYNDFALGGGDIFAFVKYLFQYKTWWEVYSRIAIDFFLDKTYLCKKDMLKTTNRSKLEYYDKPKISEKNIELNVLQREWNNADRLYWKQYSIRLKTLQKYRVLPISHVFFKTDSKEKVIKTDKISYCYIEHKDGKCTYKVYQPYSKYKWINNHDSSVWQGWEQLPSYDDILIITKSLKDVMCINQLTGLPSVSLQSEKTKPKFQIINNLKQRFKNNIYILYDNDYDKEVNIGQDCAKELCNNYQFNNIVIPNEYKSKDFSDLIKNHGKDEAIKILKSLIDDFNEPKELIPDNECPF